MSRRVGDVAWPASALWWGSGDRTPGRRRMFGIVEGEVGVSASPKVA
jgi:hypothetical protein